MLKKNNNYFLQFIIYPLFIITLLIISFNSIAAQKAIVTSPKAIIYADKEMTSPIGFVAKGKIINIGNKMLFQKTVATTVVSGKLAYIKTADISLNLKD